MKLNILVHKVLKVIVNLSSKKLVHGIPKILKPEKSCEICMKGKQLRFPFAPEVAPREKHVLGVFHVDVCGSFEVPSLGGNNYFVSFVDGFTRMT